MHDKSRHKAAATEMQILEFLVTDIAAFSLFTKPTGNSPSLLSHPEKNKLMSNVLAWMRAKPCLYMDVPSWRVRSYQFIV
ncbi:hypothetical protein [Pseudoalteromonas phenolica]|uniref:hypothetical protein n=1 Tax=Pseudoalteromonas phenolica TaxID=161398 RepID=UPI001109FAED|nr:hypothetical protein [Pseudoalteromonas phenolica]